jgi:hypothetical protein
MAARDPEAFRLSEMVIGYPSDISKPHVRHAAGSRAIESIFMSVTLPPPIERLVAAINGGDTEAFLDCFTGKGVVNDWGRRFTGREAIRGWSDVESIGAKGIMTVTGVERKGGQIIVTAGWISNFFSGPSRYVFRLDGDLIAEMRITGA